MTVEQVLQLVEKGFSRDDIMALVNEPSTPEQVQDQDQDQEQNQEQNQEQDQDQHQDQDQNHDQIPDAVNKRLEGIEKNINSLIKAVQSNNLRNDSFNTNPDSLEEQTDKIMASIIREERKEGNK